MGCHGEDVFGEDAGYPVASGSRDGDVAGKEDGKRQGSERTGRCADDAIVLDD